MKTLNIKNLTVDGRSFIFKPGINYIVGPNASGKTTIFNYLKYAFGVLDISSEIFFQRIALTFSVDKEDFTFIRDAGNSFIETNFKGNIVAFKARSPELDDFLRSIFEPDFPIGSKLTSMFPLLDFCFFSESPRPGSKSLLDVFRMICGANDRLISTASKEADILRAEIDSDNEFFSRNEIFVKSFLDALGSVDQSVQGNITNALETAKKSLLQDLAEKNNVFTFAVNRIQELTKRNNEIFDQNNLIVEHSFSFLSSEFLNLKSSTISLKDVLGRRTKNISYGGSILAEFIMTVSIAHASKFVKLNFPGILISDRAISRIDDYSLRKMNNLLRYNFDNFDGFQYIEFTCDVDKPAELIVASLGVLEQRG